MMSKTYEDEQAQLKVEIVNLQREIEVQERQIDDLEQFIQRARRYTDLTELTPYALRKLVKAVYVEAPDNSAVNANRQYISNMTLLASSPWMNRQKRNRHDFGHACSKKFTYYCFTTTEHSVGFFIFKMYALLYVSFKTTESNRFSFRV